ncbi:4-hydroxy-tetrahydrodipicolinate synthase [Oribacterium sp. oral taxon 102]|uniref:4-hydroxy-tetrahydrodipicolinate synthase n=1 Tax=Oribacterium sp. oral taxon 102 TaxID=671214 RepID=UPI0015BABE4F|nr:4-hydroxy-tetrahydrodipicolinate synthase [Oribacterium sp. oral taxon 102]NWO21966.1 4-hydroxy-tetrahydrodipicolinate synthase [Oribacterium sp. oral taxon 102]
MAVFQGAGVALITPFHADGSVNYEKLAELLEEQIAGGTDAIIACGTTAEAATLSEEEHSEVIRYCVRVVNHRIPVIAGTGSNCTATAVKLSREAEAAGADGLLLVTPYYNKATQDGLFRHFAQIAESVRIPCILYNVPSRTGMTILPETMARLYHEVENIVGVKDATGNIAMSSALMALVDERFELFSGNDDEIVPLLSIGGSGVISVLSNIAPRQTHEICQRWFDGDIAGARREQLRALPLIRALFSEVNPIPVKAAANLMGMEVGSLRLPLTDMEEKNREVLEKEMKKYGIL